MSSKNMKADNSKAENGFNNSFENKGSEAATEVVLTHDMQMQDKLSRQLAKNRGMNGKRRVNDGFKKFFTYLSAALAVYVLGSVLVYIFSNGWNDLSHELITGDYWSGNYNVSFVQKNPGDFEAPGELEEGSYFSNKFGFAVKDAKNPSKKDILQVTYVANSSPLRDTAITTAGPMKGQTMEVTRGVEIRSINYYDAAGELHLGGLQYGQHAEEFISELDEYGDKVDTMYFQTPGGGIRGSIIATLMLILVTLLVSLPIGIFAAIYLNEIAGDNKFTQIIRSAVEMLNGVPSIIFGLMGITVLFPITSWFGATTTNVLLGGLTMGVILLPVIIRQTEEALKTVPDSLRMGSLALGATKTQTIFKVVLPNALPGILSAALLSISRTMGESAALIYTMGSSVNDNPGWTSSGTSLAVQIWSVMSGEQPNFELASAISILILIVVLIMNILVRVITKQLNKKWEKA